MTAYNLISCVGLATFMVVAWAVSKNRRNVNWRVVGWATAIQLAFGMMVFQTSIGRNGLPKASAAMEKLIELGNEGVVFVFGPLASSVGEKSLGFVFAFQALPVIIFFSALMALLYYFGILPVIVRAFAWVFAITMRVSGGRVALHGQSDLRGGGIGNGGSALFVENDAFGAALFDDGGVVDGGYERYGVICVSSGRCGGGRGGSFDVCVGVGSAGGAGGGKAGVA